jgi:hypothetical protein
MAVNGQMAIQEAASAQILLVLASNDSSQVRQLTRDLQRSSYAYAFSHHGEKKGVLAAIETLLAGGEENLPTVLVLNYKFVGRDCQKILQMVREAAGKRAVACVVTHPPADQHTRHLLSALGARLFDESMQLEPSQFALH